MSRIKSLPTKRRTDLRGFTLVELIVSMAVVGVVGLVMFSVMTSTMKLSSVNTATNMSSYRTRQALDRLANNVHYDAVDNPVMINSDGTTASGTTSDGILIKHFISGGYSFLNASGKTTDNIDPKSPSSPSYTFMVQYAAAAGAVAPKVGNFLLLASQNGDEMEISALGTTSTSGGITSTKVTTVQNVQELLTPTYYTITAGLYAKEAYIFVQNGTSAYWTLRYYPHIYTGISYSDSTKYVTLGTGFEKQGTQAWFTVSTDTANNNTKAIWLQALVRSSGHGEYAENIDKRTTATTMPLQIKLWNYNLPSGN